MPAATRQSDVKPAQRLSVVARHRAEFDIKIEIFLLALILVRQSARQRRLHKIPPIIDVAAHGSLDHCDRHLFRVPR